MRSQIFIVIAIIVAAGIAWLVDHMGAPQTTAAGPAPQFSFQSLDGKTHALHDYAGKTVLLNFWASWCIPCRAELPMLIHLAEDNPQKLQLILLSEDSAPQAANDFIKTFLLAKQLPAPSALHNVTLGWDKNQTAANLYQAAAYPESAVIAPDQSFQYKVVGTMNADDIDALQPLLQK